MCLALGSMLGGNANATVLLIICQLSRIIKCSSLHVHLLHKCRRREGEKEVEEREIKTATALAVSTHRPIQQTASRWTAVSDAS